MMPMRFPPGFLWGVATAAYQIEGSVQADGRGESIWDRFSHTPDKTFNGDTGDVACDHYRRYEQDIDLMANLGVQAYRFSVAWPRIFPEGGATVNQKGLDFYRRLVERRRAKSILPAVTLYHWDLPQALQDKGGWANRDTAERFAEYADTLFGALGEQVPFWITHNEPWCAGFLGHYRGIHAPGIQDLATALTAIHHMLLSHGYAVRRYRELKQQGQIGITLNLLPTFPFTESEADQVAARLSDGYTNRWFLDPVLRGEYPSDTAAHFERLAGPLAFIREGDLAAISEPMDFLGINYYHCRVIEAAPGYDLGWKVQDQMPDALLAALGWENAASGLTALLLRLREEYRPLPLYITENGAACDDEIGEDGAVHDAERVSFLREHFAAAARAIEAGADLRGYFVWSFMDNYEWALGYSKRFGITYVDYATQRRIPKESAHFLQSVIASNGLEAAAKQPDGGPARKGES